MKKKDQEENVYDEDFVEEAIDDDEISPEEEGFMLGYNDALELEDEEEDFDDD